MAPERQSDKDRGSAVCFTAGLSGVPFALGVIHAYLVTEQKAPKIVAGISGGALSAAAMQRCYQELDRARQAGGSLEQLEEARWRWFRRYLAMIVESPFDVIWKAIPDVSDILAERPPIREPALPTSTKEDWNGLEKHHRLEFYLFTKLFSWLLHLRLSVRDLARLAIAHVRANEKYPDGLTWPWVRQVIYLWRKVQIALCVNWAVLRHPHFLIVRSFASHEQEPIWCRPLFGCRVWVLSLMVLFVELCLLTGFLWLLVQQHFGWLALLAGIFLSLFIGVAVRESRTESKQSWLSRLVNLALSHTHLQQGLLDDFYLKRKLSRLFEHNGQDALVCDSPMPALMVACPLESLTKPGVGGLPSGPVQLWPSPNSKGTETVANAVAACFAVPGLLPPVAVSRKEAARLRAWINPRLSELPGDTLHLVDGAVVRRNPLPALLDAIKRSMRAQNGSPADDLSALLSDKAGDYRVHLVYNRPIHRNSPTVTPNLDTDGKAPPLPNCVDSAIHGVGLAARRDSRLEVWQTNYHSEFALALKAVTIPPAPGRPANGVLPILVDEIAPSAKLELGNVLAPEESDLLRYAADGCRRTLCTLYRQESALTRAPVNCPDFLEQLRMRPSRIPASFAANTLPGLTEICSHCTRKLFLSEDDVKVATGRPQTLRMAEDVLPKGFLDDPQTVMPDVKPDAARIVFVASGGVFRGAFHIGMVAALRAVDVRPNLIVGASVGTLMGAVLAEMTVSDDTAFRTVLSSLVEVFLNVDQRVGLTKRLKGAARDLAVRGNTVALTPAQVRESVLKGSSGNSGFAAAGAPPELVDAISRMFVIPYEQTKTIAAKFVAEKIVDAVNEFMKNFRSETVGALGVKHAVIGAELLEARVRELLASMGDRLHSGQPFSSSAPGADGLRHKLAFFGTTVNLIEEWTTILGADIDKQRLSYDFVQATLSSSAFPLAFAPRRESQIYPGLGRRDVFFGDGGMFDNLPFMPAMLVLGALQQHVLRKSSGVTKLRDLQRRFENPDLFLVGALDANPHEGAHPIPLDNMLDVWKRAGQLENNEKIRSFERMSSRLHRNLREPVANAALNANQAGHSVDWDVLNGFVHPGVLSIYPTSPDHLNGTFAFSRSLGFTKERVGRSIADGCYQTLARLQSPWITNPGRSQDNWPLGELALARLQVGDKSRVPILTKTDRIHDGKGKCPFFLKRDEQFTCPFVDAKQPAIYSTCCADKEKGHRAASSQ